MTGEGSLALILRPGILNREHMGVDKALGLRGKGLTHLLNSSLVNFTLVFSLENRCPFSSSTESALMDAIAQSGGREAEKQYALPDSR